MEDYLADVESVARQVEAAEGQHPVLAGWSMGGLLAMMCAAGNPGVPGLILFSPSPPEEVAGRGAPDLVRQTPSEPIGPETYGVYPDDLDASRPVLFDLTDAEAESVLANSAGALESGLARRQRRRGIRVPPGAVRCPALVVYGEEETAFPPAQNRRLALYLAGESLAVPGAGHWGIVYSRDRIIATAPEIDAWLRRNLHSR
jgi:pimeloyl-ACP methyl ester carboxylesterase